MVYSNSVAYPVSKKNSMQARYSCPPTRTQWHTTGRVRCNGTRSVSGLRCNQLFRTSCSWLTSIQFSSFETDCKQNAT